MNQKPSEAGWFYHAPAKKAEHLEPVGAPPASQIPGLGDVSVLPPEQPKEMMFRDTDSKYIRLAKMGGRKDLLVIRPNSGTKREPKSYPRNDWFYLEDNAQQDKAKQDAEKEVWQFLLPDYMVHQSMGQSMLPENRYAGPPQNLVPMRPAPFATQQQSLSACNVQEKPAKAKAHSKNVRTGKTTSRNRHLSPRLQDEPPRLKYQPLSSEQEEPTNMAKLLAYTYEREWHDKHKAWEEKQATNKKKTQLAKSSEQGTADRKSQAVSNTSGREQTTDANNNQMPTIRNHAEEKKEPFKLSKFKKTPARLDTHRSVTAGPAKGK